MKADGDYVPPGSEASAVGALWTSACKASSSLRDAGGNRDEREFSTLAGHTDTQTPTTPASNLLS